MHFVKVGRSFRIVVGGNEKTECGRKQNCHISTVKNFRSFVRMKKKFKFRMRVFHRFYAHGFTLCIVACLMHAWHQKLKSRTKKGTFSIEKLSRLNKKCACSSVSTGRTRSSSNAILNGPFNCLTIVLRKKATWLIYNHGAGFDFKRIVERLRNLLHSTNIFPYTCIVCGKRYMNSTL